MVREARWTRLGRLRAEQGGRSGGRAVHGAVADPGSVDVVGELYTLTAEGAVSEALCAMPAPKEMSTLCPNRAET